MGLAEVRLSVPLWVRRRPLVLGACGAAGTGLVLGVPTGVIANPWFERKLPVRGFEMIVLVVLSVIAGLLAATCARPSNDDAGVRRAGAASGLVGWLAVGCPLCNPVVVGLLGTSGATGIFARVQPVLGALAIALAASALAVRVRAVRRGTCRVPASSPVSSATAPGPRAGADAHTRGML
jgi:hypothetical protein